MWNLYLYDFASTKETPLTTGRTHAVSPRFSPDGRQVAFLRDGKELCVVSVDTKQVRYAAIGTFLWVLIATVIAHRYWTYPPAQQGGQYNNFP